MDTKHGIPLNRKAWTEADKENFKALSMDERKKASKALLGHNMNENNPKVALTNEQRESLAGTLDIFAEALRERRELRAADFGDIIAEIRHFQQSPKSPTPSQPGPDYPSDRGRMVYVEEIRIISSTQIAGSKGAQPYRRHRALPETVREQFPGRGAYFIRPIPEGRLPAFIFMVALVCYQPTSDTTADLFELVVSWSSDDFDSLPELIEREIRDIPWDWMARSKGWSTPAEKP